MSAAEMREASALAAHDALFDLCFGKHGGDLSNVTCADVSNAATSAIRALPLPDEDGMVERVARALAAYQFSREDYWEDQVDMALFVIRAINGGEP